MARDPSLATLSLGRRRVLIAEPSAGQDGHLGLEVLTAMALARQADAGVYFVRRRHLQSSGIFELESPDVPIVSPAAPISVALRSWLRLMVSLSSFGHWKDDLRIEVRRELVAELGRHLRRSDLPSPVVRDVRLQSDKIRERADTITARMRSDDGYLRRRLLHDRIRVQLRPDAHERAARQALAHGIDPDAPLICVHNSETGHERGRETPELKPRSGRDDNAGHGRIESYFPVIDEFVRRGYTVVRLGDQSMQPVARRGVVDLATAAARSQLLEIYCLLRSELILTGESGIAGLGYLTNVPMIVVNVTEPISSYPIRAPGLFIPKTIIDRHSASQLPLRAQFEQKYLSRFRDQKRYFYVETPPDAIVAAAIEMLEWVKGRWVESREQREYHDAITAAAALLRRENAHVRRWGPDAGFLGDGRIARAAFA